MVSPLLVPPYSPILPSPQEREKEKEEATTLELYNLLLAGKKLRLSFPSLPLAEKCRGAIAVLKHRQEKELRKLGLMSEEEVAIFSCTVSSHSPTISSPDILGVLPPKLLEKDNGPVTLLLQFLEREEVAAKRKYTYEIVEEVDSSDSEDDNSPEAA